MTSFNFSAISGNQFAVSNESTVTMAAVNTFVPYVTLATPTKTEEILTPNTIASINHFHDLDATPIPSPVDLSQQRSRSHNMLSKPSDDEKLMKDDPEWLPHKKMNKSYSGVKLGQSSGYSFVPLQPKVFRSLPRTDDTEVNLTPTEQKRKQLRRERNKEAAARCRQRRVDLTNRLQAEADLLEAEHEKLKVEVDGLKSQLDHYALVMEAHKPFCKLSQEEQPVAPLSTRPTSLALPPSPGPGIPITTPSTVATLDFDMLSAGRTGITPMTTTPCATEAHRSSTSSNDSLLSPSLTAL